MTTAVRDRDVARKREDANLSRIVVIPALSAERRLERERLEADDCAWLRFFFPVLFWYEWQPQQREMIEAIRHAIVKGDDQALAASRGEGKTKIAERLLLKYSLQGAIKLSVLFAATGSGAEDSLDAIKGEIEENDKLAEFYPEVCVPVRALENTPNRAHYQQVSGDRHDNGKPYEAANSKFSWCGQQIVFPVVPGSPSAGAIIATRGLDAAVRGLNKRNRRVDVAIIDDPDTEDSARSEDQAAKLMARIDRAIGGLGGQQRGVGRVVITTLQSRIAVSFQLTDAAQKPSMKGRRFRFMLQRPERMDLWEQYIQLRKEDWHNERNGEPTTHARELYEANRAAMDAGAIVANPYRHYPDQLSAIQFYFDEWARKNEGYVLTELDNDPPEDEGISESGINPRLVQMQVATRPTPEIIDGELRNGYVRGEIPPGCTVLVHGVDVGKWWLHWVVRAFKPDGTGYTIDYGRQNVYDTKFKSEEGLDRAIRREILRRVAEFRDMAYSQQIRESLTLVDSGYRTEAVYAACLEAGLGVMPIKGIGMSAGTAERGRFVDVMKRTRDKQPICDGVFYSTVREPGQPTFKLVCASADQWKAWEHDRWMTAQDKPGCMFVYGEKSQDGKTLTTDQREHGHYAHHICAEVEVEDVVKGGLVRKWKSKNKENHWLDASYYADVAAAIKGVRVIGVAGPVGRPPPAERKTIAQMRAGK